MGFSEKKYKMIKDLETAKKEKDKELSLATTKKTASEKTLANKTTISDQDKTDKDKAEANHKTSGLAKDSVTSLLKDIDTSSKSAEAIHIKVSKMVEDAYQTVSKAISFAVLIDEFDTFINNEVKDNKVILNLLVKDSAKAVLDAKTAVNLSVKAWIDSITAAGSVIQLSHSLIKTKEVIETILPLLTDKTKGLDNQLEVLKSNALTAYEQSSKDKKAAEQALLEVIKKFNDATTEANTATKALDAANAAVGQAA